MKTILTVAALAACAAGCAGYTRAKIDLTTQAQAGVTLVRHEVDAQRGRADAASDALRSKLDAAFDEDVASRDVPLDADWVIAHRKAYALAVDAFDADRRAADAEAQTTLRNLDAIDAALTQLQVMHTSELKLSLPDVKFPEVTR